VNAQERAAEAGVQPTAHIMATPDGRPRAFEFRHWCYAFDEWGVVGNVHPLPTVVDLGPDTATWPAPRHTHRDPTTGRYTRRGEL